MLQIVDLIRKHNELIVAVNNKAKSRFRDDPRDAEVGLTWQI